MRNFGWICKGLPHPGGNNKIAAGVQLYYCQFCGVNPANEYCLDCAAKMQWKCPRCHGRLIPG